MQNKPPFFHQRAKAGLDWLIRSIDATGGQGSSHIFARWRYPPSGWHLGYPETTGYIIETLLDYEPLYPSLPLREYAMKSAAWLLTQQLDSGAFPVLLSGSQVPSFFNSGMIVFGLLRAEKIAPDPQRRAALSKGKDWLLKLSEEEILATEPSYTSRALWAFLLLAYDLSDDHLHNKVKFLLKAIHERKNEYGAISYWGFGRNQRAFTHTIAYTLRGLLETGILLHEEQYIQCVSDAMEILRKDRNKRHQLAGSYDETWQGDYSFRCVTGHAQLSIVGFRLYNHTHDRRWLDFARVLMEDIVHDQKLNPIDPQLHGAVPGSKPIWGPYMRGKYPNWSVKFYLDALLLYAQTD